MSKSILIVEDEAAIADSGVMAALMIATRKVDWYQIGKIA